MDWQDDTTVDQTTRTEVDLEPPWGDLTVPELTTSTDWDVPTIITHAVRPRRGTGTRSTR